MEDRAMDSSGSDEHTPVATQAKQVVQQAQQKAGEALSQAGDQLVSRIESQKETAADSLGNVALAVRQASERLREQEQAGMGERAEGLATMAENLSGYLRRTDVNQFIGEIKDFARERPALFLGSAFSLGLWAARFMKSSGQANNAPSSGNGAAMRPLPAPAPVSAPAPARTSAPDTDYGSTVGTAGGSGAYGTGATDSEVTTSEARTRDDASGNANS